MSRELMELFEAFQLDLYDLRAIIVTGAGEKAFCAGGDLKERKGMTDAQWQAQHAVFERMARAILACPIPVIAAVNGAAFAGGCEIAALCDFIYASDNARFALTEVTLGIMPGAGGTQTLSRAIGERRAKELILTGTPFSAADAAQWGFVNRVLPQAALLDTAMETARRIASNGPIAVRQAKQAITRGLQMSLADGLAFEIEAYNRMVPTEDRREGILAFNEKRKPNFRGV
jgi:enoyl-CoA hydratase/carnithine racemase